MDLLEILQDKLRHHPEVMTNIAKEMCYKFSDASNGKVEVKAKNKKGVEKPDELLKNAFEDNLITKDTEIHKYAQNDVKDSDEDEWVCLSASLDYNLSMILEITVHKSIIFKYYCLS